MPLLIFEPSVTIEECRAAGQELGRVWGNRPRLAFERALIARLTALGDAFSPAGLDADEAQAALDQAAWAAWEAAQAHASGDQAAPGARPAPQKAKASD